jgi:outer membrane protein TolC
MKFKLLLLLYFTTVFASVEAQMVFTSVDSLFQYANSRNISLRSGNIKLDQARKARLAAILSIPDVTGNLSFSYTNNTKLAVNLFPAEVFGGQPGTYREVQSGVRYNTYGNENVDVKLLNLKGWQNLKLYKLNIESNAADNKVTLKQLHENISATYYNIVTLQEQLISTKENIVSADALLQITQNKYDAGLIKKQDVNDAKVNSLTEIENLNQLQYLIQQQYLALKIICDIPELESISIVQSVSVTDAARKPLIESNYINVASSLAKEKIALVNYKQQKYALYPTVSFFQSYTTQQFNTRGKFLDNNVNWIPSSYIGLRLSIPIPSSNSISQLSKAKYDYLLAAKGTEQQIIQTALETKQLRVEYEKAVSQVNSNSDICVLRKDTYEKNVNLYKEGLISLEQTLNSFNSMVTSNYNLVSAQVAVLSAKAKININNSIK